MRSYGSATPRRRALPRSRRPRRSPSVRRRSSGSTWSDRAAVGEDAVRRRADREVGLRRLAPDAAVHLAALVVVEIEELARAKGRERVRTGDDCLRAQGLRMPAVRHLVRDDAAEVALERDVVHDRHPTARDRTRSAPGTASRSATAAARRGRPGPGSGGRAASGRTTRRPRTRRFRPFASTARNVCARR